MAGSVRGTECFRVPDSAFTGLLYRRIFFEFLKAKHSDTEPDCERAAVIGQINVTIRHEMCASPHRPRCSEKKVSPMRVNAAYKTYRGTNF